MWIDNDFPKLLGAELYRPHPAEMAVEPVVVHDFSSLVRRSNWIATASGASLVLRSPVSGLPIKPLDPPPHATS